MDKINLQTLFNMMSQYADYSPSDGVMTVRSGNKMYIQTGSTDHHSDWVQ